MPCLSVFWRRARSLRSRTAGSALTIVDARRRVGNHSDSSAVLGPIESENWSVSSTAHVALDVSVINVQITW